MKILMLASLLLSSMSSAAPAAILKISRCSDLQYIADQKEKKNYVMNSSYSGGVVTWSQDGKDFVLNFSDVSSDVASSLSTLGLNISQDQKDSRGRILSTDGKGRAFVVMNGKLTTADKTFQNTRVYASPDSNSQFVVKTTMNGKSIGDTTVITSPADTEPVTTVQKYTDVDYPVSGLEVKDRALTCTESKISLTDAMDEFEPFVLKAIATFSGVIKRVDDNTTLLSACTAVAGKDCSAAQKALVQAQSARDSGFLKLVSGKAFFYVKRSLNPAPTQHPANPSGVTTVVVNPGPNLNGHFGGPHGRGCSHFGSALSCDEGPGTSDSLCTTFGNGFSCANAGGNSVCTPFGDGYECNGPTGATVCTPLGDGYNCSP